MNAVLLARLRESWAHQTYPLLVEHDEGGGTRLCPATTLWTGGRAVADHLRASGYGAGARIGFTGAAGISWVWAMLGCLAEGCVFVPFSPRWPVALLAERLRQVPPHAVLDSDGTLTPFAERAPAEAKASAIILWPRGSRHPQTIGSAALLDRLMQTPRAAAVGLVAPPVHAVLDDGMDVDSALELLLALAVSAEVHVAPMPLSTSDSACPAPDQPAP